MGGFFGGSAPAPAYTPPVVTTDPDAEARKQREEVMARNRRGRAGMVATSERGVLDPAAPKGGATTKSLLGE